MPTYGKTVRTRRLATLLRRMREDVQLSAEEAAKRAQVSASTITRLERGESIRPKLPRLRALLDTYGIDDEPHRRSVLDLARSSGSQDWWTEYSDVFPDAFPDFEQAASRIRSFEPLVIPGLLQTPAYAAEVFRPGHLRRDEIERAVATRIQRQRILRESPPQAWFVVDEAALLRVPAGIAGEQYQALIDAAEMPTVGLQVVPLGAGVHAGAGGQFCILDFPAPADSPLVYVETALDGLWREKPAELTRYMLIYDYLRGDALSVADSVAWLRERIDQL